MAWPPWWSLPVLWRRFVDCLATLVVTSSFLEDVRGWLGHPGGHLQFSGGGSWMAWPPWWSLPVLWRRFEDGLATLVVTSSSLEEVRGWLGHPGGHFQFSGKGSWMAWPPWWSLPVLWRRFEDGLAIVQCLSYSP